jgi:hypothetical protein
MRVSLFQLLLIIALVALTATIFTVSQSYRVALEQLKSEQKSEADKYHAWRTRGDSYYKAQLKYWETLSGMHALTKYGNISYFRCRDDDYQGTHGVLLRLDPQKSYALRTVRRWGVVENPSKVEDETLVIDALQSPEFASQLLSLRVRALPDSKISQEEWAFAGYINVIASFDSFDANNPASNKHVQRGLGLELSKVKLHRTPERKNFLDYLQIAQNIESPGPTTVIWFSGWSDDTQGVQSLLVTIEELGPERLPELSKADRF